MGGIGMIKDYFYRIDLKNPETQHGINGGKITYLQIRRRDKGIYLYDKVLVFDDLDADGEEIYSSLLKMYN